jgi:hypothetical protein
MGFEDELKQSLGRSLQSDERQVQADMRTHLIHRPATDITVALDQRDFSTLSSAFFPA